MKTDPYTPARLLSGKKDLCVLEKEQILRKILEKSGARPAAASWMTPRVLGWSVAVVVVLALIPVLVYQFKAQDGFQSRGAASAAAEFGLNCLGKPGVCHPGDKLFFQVRSPEHQPFLSSFARRVSDGTVIWYFPGSAAESSIEVPAKSRDGVLTTAVLLGPEHPPGEYQGYGLFSARPLSRDQIRELMEEDVDSDERGPLVMKTKFKVVAK